MYLFHDGSVNYELEKISKRINEEYYNEDDLVAIIQGLILTIDRISKAESRKVNPDLHVYEEILDGLKEVL